MSASMRPNFLLLPNLFCYWISIANKSFRALDKVASHKWSSGTVRKGSRLDLTALLSISIRLSWLFTKTFFFFHFCLPVEGYVPHAYARNSLTIIVDLHTHEHMYYFVFFFWPLDLTQFTSEWSRPARNCKQLATPAWSWSVKRARCTVHTKGAEDLVPFSQIFSPGHGHGAASSGGSFFIF